MPKQYETNWYGHSNLYILIILFLDLEKRKIPVLLIHGIFVSVLSIHGIFQDTLRHSKEIIPVAIIDVGILHISACLKW